MIDEFQDTSGMQWNNFRPLIEESLAHSRDNLIVGDVKQSIYRFRNSDWKLLDEQVQADFSPEVVHEETLKDNWRSCRNIVEFNNALFTTLPGVLQAVYNEALSVSSLSEEQRAAFSLRSCPPMIKVSNRFLPLSCRKTGMYGLNFSPEIMRKIGKRKLSDVCPACWRNCRITDMR